MRTCRWFTLSPGRFSATVCCVDSMKGHPMEWTDEVIARLRTLWDEGHSTAEIGRRLGVSKNAIVGKAHRLSLPPRPSPIRRDPAAVQRVTAPAPRRPVGSTLPPLAEPPLARPQAATPRPVTEDAGERPTAEPRVAQPSRIPSPPPAMAAIRTSPRQSNRVICCCWPIGEPGTRSFRFCDTNALAGKPYCAEHAQLAYVKVRDRREEAA